MVMIHAVIISRTTRHCTAFFPRVAPTPMIAPLIAWVEETGMPASVHHNKDRAACGRRTESLVRADLRDLLCHLVHNLPSPETGAEADRDCRGEDDPLRYIEGQEDPGGHEQGRDHTDRVLAVVRPVGGCLDKAREHVERLEDPLHVVLPGVPEEVGDENIEEEGAVIPMIGEMKMKSTIARSPPIWMIPASIRTGMIRAAPQIAPSMAPNRVSSLNEAVNRPSTNRPDDPPDQPRTITSPSAVNEGRITAAGPATAIPAPSSPPTIAWLLESGMPARVATKTRTIAAPMATTIESGVRPLWRTIAVPMVAATAVVKRNGPIMLQIAVYRTALTR